MATVKNVLDDWYERVAITQRAHYLAADHFSRKSYLLGIPVIGLTTLVGTSVFATLQKQPERWLQLTVGFASVFAAILASLQTFLGYSERAEKHRVAGAKYGALGRELEALRASAKEPSDEALGELRKRLDALALESPNNPVWIYRIAGIKTATSRESGLTSLGKSEKERQKGYFLAAYIAFLVAGAAGGSKLMPLGPVAAAVTVLSFAVTLLILDCVNQIFGQEEAKNFVVPGFLSLLLATGSMWIFVHIPFDAMQPRDFQTAYALILLPPFRMFLAGLAAYVVGQSLNILIFDKIRKKTTFEQRGRRSLLSTLLSQFIDTLIFVPGAFWGLNGITLSGVEKIFIGQFAIKALIAIFVSYPVFLFLTKVFSGVDSKQELIAKAAGPASP